MFVSSRRHALLHTALAALVVAALAHCMWEDSRELAHWTRTVALHRAALPTPIQAPIHDCDHEYGCICRGATQVLAVDVAHFQALATTMLPLDLPSLTDGWIAGAAAAVRSADENLLPSAMSGRQLRALYASLLI